MATYDEGTGFEPVFPRRPPRPPRRHWRRLVLLLIPVLLLAAAYWWWPDRPASLAAGKADIIIIAQSARVCGGHNQPAHSPVWLAPDRLAVAFAEGNGSALYTVTLDGARQPLISAAAADQWQFKAMAAPLDCRQPAVHPDRQTLAFVRGGDIWLRAADGAQRQLTLDGQAGQPAWSPDGEHVYFASRRSGRLAIYRCEPSATPEQATAICADNEFAYAAPAVSPDGNWLALVSNRGGSPDLWLAHLPDGKLTRLTASPAVETAPAWSPDGAMLAYCAGDDRNTDLWVINSDGSKATQRTFTTTSEFAPAWSPDGSRFACQVGSGAAAEIWVYTIGYAGYNTPATR